MAHHSEELNHHHLNDQVLRRVQSSSSRQISGQLIQTSDGHSNIRTLPFIQNESWREHYKLLTKQLKEELRQNQDTRRSGNSSSHINSNHIHNKKNGQQSNGGAKSKIPVKQNGILFTKRKISDSNSSIQRGGDVEFAPRSQLECQVCQLKEIRSNILQMNKVVTEQNEKILRLKAKYLRDYFERQMMD